MSQQSSKVHLLPQAQPAPESTMDYVRIPPMS